ncbi:MAG: helix-turn-helix domain-containing protein [Stappia sp.]|nr:helix-turn-helix domain-containing protein [Stappia sp.]MBM21414.1 helix-turn-helix domain-containing protein [Stappia sp.]
MVTSYDYLPGILAEIADVAGLDAALKLAAEKGGQTVYIPSHASDDHWLTSTVGPEAASAICELYRVRNTGGRFLIPIAREASARRTLVQALVNGASARQAAAASGLHERTAFRARRRLKAKDPSQGDLF